MFPQTSDAVRDADFFRDLSNDLCTEIDERLGNKVRCELYFSKIVYLRKLLTLAMRYANLKNQANEPVFNFDDLEVIKKAIEINDVYLKQNLKELVKNSLNNYKLF